MFCRLQSCEETMHIRNGNIERKSLATRTCWCRTPLVKVQRARTWLAAETSGKGNIATAAEHHLVAARMSYNPMECVCVS